MLFKKLMIAAVLSTVTATAFAGHNARLQASQIHDLKDGSILYVFADGKMALENRFGHAAPLQEGVVLETRNGQKITVSGNATMRLSELLDRGHADE